MLKAIKKNIKKRLGSSSKLHEQGGDSDTGLPATAVPAAATAAAAPPAPAAPATTLPQGLPPAFVRGSAANGAFAELSAGQQASLASEAISALVAAGAAGSPPGTGGGSCPVASLAAAAAAVAAAGAAAGTLPDQQEQQQNQHQQQHGVVDYELLLGQFELDAEACPTADHAIAAEGSGGDDAAESHPQQQQQRQRHRYAAAEDEEQHDGHDELCYGSPEGAGTPTAEEAAAEAAAMDGSDGATGGGGSSSAGAGTDGAADRAAGSGGADADAASIADALATMMYLTEDAEGEADCLSVVSDALSDDDLPDDISELSRALEALEGEALGTSPGASSSGLGDQLAERLGLSPDAADPTAFSQQMAKLYNNLGLKMMERRKHEEALGLLRKAEAVVDNDAMWQGQAEKRQRMKAITYNNLGCLFKRRNMPQLALQYLQRALALEETGGPVQNSSSTHLNICAAFSALKRPKEALSHAERAIILLQRHLWAPHLPFQEGLNSLVKHLAAPGASRHLLASANVLAMAYHNAAVEHEKLGRLKEGLVSFTRAYLISSRCLGPKAQMTSALHRALKAFQQRQARHLPSGAAHAARKAPSLAAGRATVAAAQAKRTGSHSRAATKSIAASKSGGSSKSVGSLAAAAAASGKATLPLDKGRTSSGTIAVVRAPSSNRLAVSHLQPLQQP